jgi:hypothetical protein
VKVFDAGVGQARGEHGLREPGAAGGGDGAHIDQQVDAGGLQPLDYRGLGVAFISDGGERRGGQLSRSVFCAA